MRKRHIVPLAVIALMAAASVFAVLHFDELQERIYDGRKASERSALKDPVFADVETGNFFACGLTTSGYVYCWGDNHYGQLGTGSYTELSDQPKLVVDAGGFTNGHVTSITAGDFHTCAVSDGTAYCWGNNMVGQLGSASAGQTSNVPVPVDPSGSFLSKEVSEIRAGYMHTCAVEKSQVFCWGNNGWGQTGQPVSKQGSAASSSVPAPVPNVPGGFVNSDISKVAAADNFSCAVSLGKLYCWGNNQSGQLGNGSFEMSSQPSLVKSLSGTDGSFKNDGHITDVAAASGHVCAVEDGQAWCWGNNDQGQLGTGSLVSSIEPAPVKDSLSTEGRVMFANKNIVGITTGILHTCLVNSEGRSFCWGNNVHGELGRGTVDTEYHPVPAKVAEGRRQRGIAFTNSGVTRVSAGMGSTCLVSAGRIFCFGYNSRGQLGTGEHGPGTDEHLPAVIKIK